MFENLKTDSAIKGQETDNLGGRQLFDTNVYPGKITMAYAKKSDSGAMALALTVKLEDGREFSKDTYVTNKLGQNYYERDGEKHYLPGFNLVNSLCLLTTGQELSALAHETKTVKVYNSEAKAEVPTPVPVMVDLLGQDIIIAIERVIDDKQTKGDDGKYYPTGETVEVNEIAKFFCAKEGYEGLTQTEIKDKRAGKELDGRFMDKWLEKNKGQVRNKAKGAAAGGAAGKPSAAGAAGAPAKKPTSSLFG
jgi:hypothetical protein